MIKVMFEDWVEIKELIDSLMKGQGISLRDLADKARVSHSTVRRMRQDPSSALFSNFVRIIKALGAKTLVVEIGSRGYRIDL